MEKKSRSLVSASSLFTTIVCMAGTNTYDVAPLSRRVQAGVVGEMLAMPLAGIVRPSASGPCPNDIVVRCARTPSGRRESETHHPGKTSLAKEMLVRVVFLVLFVISWMQLQHEGGKVKKLRSPLHRPSNDVDD